MIFMVNYNLVVNILNSIYDNNRYGLPSLLAFIIKTCLGVTLVNVRLNLKLDPDGGENSTSFV